MYFVPYSGERSVWLFMTCVRTWGKSLRVEVTSCPELNLLNVFLRKWTKHWPMYTQPYTIHERHASNTPRKTWFWRINGIINRAYHLTPHEEDFLRKNQQRTRITVIFMISVWSVIHTKQYKRPLTFTTLFLLILIISMEMMILMLKQKMQRGKL